MLSFFILLSFFANFVPSPFIVFSFFLFFFFFCAADLLQHRMKAACSPQRSPSPRNTHSARYALKNLMRFFSSFLTRSVHCDHQPKMKFTCDMFHPNGKCSVFHFAVNPILSLFQFVPDAVYQDGTVCISILHPPGDDPVGYESSAEVCPLLLFSSSPRPL